MKLETGYRATFEIRREQLKLSCKGSLSILYISDLHFNRHSGRITSGLIESIKTLHPDIILLGGDYVDSRKGLDYFKMLLKFLSTRANVFSIAGNHDYLFGIGRMENIITAHNVTWIEKKSFTLTCRGNRIQIDGNKPGKKNTAVDVTMLCLHKPVDITSWQQNYDLAFAGHLHGCQFVLWQSGEALYPGRIFYKWNRLKVELRNCVYLISKGLGDTLPIRYNCKRDVLLVEINPINEIAAIPG